MPGTAFPHRTRWLEEPARSFALRPRLYDRGASRTHNPALQSKIASACETDPNSKMINLKPMEAVQALFASDQPESSEQIVASLSRAIFSESQTRPAGWVQRTL